MAAEKVSVYDVITARILESLARGVVPWRKPWKGGDSAPRNLVSGKEYRGVNVLLLSCMGYTSPYWLTFKQALAAKGNVRKGEKGTPVIFWKIYDDRDEPGKRRFVLRYYTVFNAEQCDGLTLPAANETPAPPVEPIAACESIVAGYKGAPPIKHGGGQACYSPSADEIRMPERDTFDGAAEYYSTLFHEMTHSTGSSKRLARDGITDPIRFGSHKYAKEELVAECGAAFLCGMAGIEAATLENSAAYIANWSKKLKSEPRWIVEAAGQAQKAADLILGKAAKVAAADDDDTEAAA